MANTYYYPNGDVSAGAWTSVGPTTLWEAVDDDINAADDNASYIQAATETTVCELGLTPPPRQNDYDGWELKVKHRCNTALSGSIVQVDLYEGATLRAGFQSTAPSDTTWIIDTYTLTRAEAASISNYSDLRIKLTDVASPSTSRHRVTSVALGVPTNRRRHIHLAS